MNIGLYGGAAVGLKAEWNGTNKEPGTPGLAVNVKAGAAAEIRRIGEIGFGVSGDANLPLFESRTPPQELSFSGTADIGSFSIGKELAIDRHGNGTLTDLNNLGGGLGAYLVTGGTWTWSIEQPAASPPSNADALEPTNPPK